LGAIPLQFSDLHVDVQYSKRVSFLSHYYREDLLAMMKTCKIFIIEKVIKASVRRLLKGTQTLNT
jgi:hypothetical protein